MDQRFRKQEHLKSRKLIQQLFKSGKPIKAFPLLAVYLPVEDVSALQVGFSVSKRKVKLAVNRNTLKRRIKEAYRLHRNDFGLHTEKGMVVMFVYIQNGLSDYHQIEKGMKKLLPQLAEIIKPQQDNQD
tara:strand:- start:315 stop:701 length:387 start_codon:yes stop_codon:yes gene_type:complete